MLVVSSPWVAFAALMGAGVGFTLLDYSRDGDLNHRAKHTNTRYSNPRQTSSEEAWNRLSLLANASATEVTWNTSLFVALISSMCFLGLLDYARGEAHPLPSSTTGILWIMSLFIVFGLQDTIVRWKSAHRKHPAAAEQSSIIQRLRFMQEYDIASTNITKTHAEKTSHLL